MRKIEQIKNRYNSNFNIIEDLGYQFSTNKSKTKNRFIIVQCRKCSHQFKTTINNLRNLSANNCYQKHQSRNYLKVTKEWTRIRHIHKKMIDRCNNKDNSSFKRYGAQGIIVCRNWQNSLFEFYDWSIKNGYKNNLTIDRIDNNKGYCPENCRWLSLKEQSRNKRNVISLNTVKEIKSLLKEGYTNQIIANMVCTSKTRVDDISSGKSWKDIDI